MMDLSTIKKVARQHAKVARENGLELFVAEKNGDEGVRGCPFLGTYTPEGWRKVKTYWVDSSGWGSESEPALTFRRFLQNVKAGHGYAITEAGQFQAYIGEYVRIKKRKGTKI